MTTPEPKADAPANANGTRKRRLLILAATVAIGVAAYALYYFFVARYYEETDDAYVATDLVQVTNEVAGSVLAVYADNTQYVERGQLLVELDPADADIAVATAEAELARAVRQVRGLFSQSSGLQATLEAREVALKTARADLKRRQQVGEGGISAEELQHARDQVAQLEASLAATEQELATNNAQIEGTTVASHPLVEGAAAKLREAELALQRTRITAPVSGVVARRNVQIGSRLAPGTPLLAVVPLDDAWVDANFKEVQLRNMRVGQPVELHADLYGNDVEYHGTIAGVGAGSGAAFALLPPQNASGNWIKIVQRVPVRVALKPQELEAHPLRVGLSMTAEVDTHDTSGPLLARQVRGAPQRAVSSDAQATAASEKIARIIARNSGAEVPEQAATTPEIQLPTAQLEAHGGR